MVNTNEEIIKIAKKTIREEVQSIENLTSYINEEFAKIVRIIFENNGRVVITGIGKSANIATKIVSTLNSTGTPSIFMHAADAVHGDLGMIQQNDIIICISKSGNTPEIKVLAPLIKHAGNILIALVGNPKSFLAKEADYILNCYVEREACPNNLAPTSSTTAQLVMGDAIAMALLAMRGFTSKDFAKYHPGGSLGKRLYLKVSDLYPNNERPFVAPDTLLAQTILEISSKRLGCTAVISSDNKILGIVTDGDLRRMLSKDFNENMKINTNSLHSLISLTSLTAKDIMTTTPKTIMETEFAANALTLMRQNSITQLLVTDENHNYKGVIHLHDLIREGII
ncbi:MAG: KpsF/GutQ family sugar-phosphate isomerase [Bacteroidales bacterium]|jgi:arabinose-5-phosphate isomerase|nr:KpsF/GutQ family sugar-phosphate isomerase [Bacteroidales bacterium]